MKIKEISEITGLSISTLRYYDKHGLLQNLKRNNNGVREFTMEDLNTINMINCLKNSGLKISEIKNFMDLCSMGDSTIEQRLNFFINQEKVINDQIKELNNSLNLIKFKKWYYKKAMDDGTLKYVKNLNIDDMPDDIKKLYKETH